MAGTKTKTTEGRRKSRRVDRSRVELESGGHVELNVSVDLFDLNEADRTFVLGIVDEFTQWRNRQRDSKPTTTPRPAS